MDIEYICFAVNTLKLTLYICSASSDEYCYNICLKL